MEILVIVLFPILIVGAWFLFSKKRRMFKEDAERLGDGFDENAEEIPGPDTIVSAMDPMFGQYVSVNVAMMTGQFCMANWNDGYTELTIALSKSDDETNKKVTEFLDRVEKANPVKINLKWT